MLNQSQLEAFNLDGYLVVENVLELNDLEIIRCEYNALVDEIAAQRGHVAEDWQKLNFEQKLTRLIGNDPDAHEYLDISLPLKEGLDETAGIHAYADGVAQL